MTNDHEHVTDLAKVLMIAIEKAARRDGLDADDTRGCAALAAFGIAAAQLGEVGAIEYFRRVADVMENQLLSVTK